jgi:hypothetical protein
MEEFILNKRTTALLSASLVTTLMMSGLYAPVAKAEQLSATSFSTDSDGDGLIDALEVEILDLKSQDTDNDGVLDGMEDADNDGLTNLEEQSKGTNLDLTDSDGDGLKDNEEVKQYHTDPLNHDMDGDNLDDGTEIQLKLDPVNPDVDGDGVLDGQVQRSYTLPNNEYNISGTMTGTSNVPKRVIVRKTPNLLVQQLVSAMTFDIVSLDQDITYKLSIPYSENVEKEDLELFRYDTEKAKLVPIDKQKLDKKSNIVTTAL